MATASQPFRIPIATLRGRTGSTRAEKTSGMLAGVALSSAHVRADRPVEVEMVLEAVPNGIMAIGVVTAPWVADCRRCLEEVEGVITAQFRDLFEANPTEGDSYELGHDDVDIEPMIRDALFLELPLAPLCSESCKGPDSQYFAGVAADDPAEAGGPGGDPRWAGLEGLDFDNAD